MFFFIIMHATMPPMMKKQHATTAPIMIMTPLSSAEVAVFPDDVGAGVGAGVVVPVVVPVVVSVVVSVVVPVVVS